MEIIRAPFAGTEFSSGKEFGLRIGWVGARDKRVLDAFREVDRAFFVPLGMLHLAHTNSIVPLTDRSTISEPLLAAEMIDHLSLSPTDKVLEVGTASGYSAAVISHLAKEVHTVEINADLAESARERLKHLGYKNVFVHCSDGGYGLPQHAPFDGIIVTAAAKDVPEKLIDQLAIGGRLVVPIAKEHPINGKLHIYQRIDRHTVLQKEGGEVSFVPLVSDAPGCWTMEEVKNLPSLSTLRIRFIAQAVSLSERELRETLAEIVHIDPNDDTLLLDIFSQERVRRELSEKIETKRKQFMLQAAAET